MKYLRKTLKPIFALIGVTGFVLTTLTAGGSDLEKISLAELSQLLVVCMALLIIGFVGYQIVDYMQYINGDDDYDSEMY